MEHVLDLTWAMEVRSGGEATHDGSAVVAREAWPLSAGSHMYTAWVYKLHMSSMSGSYMDFPGHIRETDDGRDAADWAIHALYRVPAAVVHLDRADGSGGIGADELREACPAVAAGGGLIINALGGRRFDEIQERSVWLQSDAVGWIVGQGVRLLVSDVYESSSDPQNVFFELFDAGVVTVCLPVNLHRIDVPRVRVTALPARIPGVTQLPCRVVAEW